MRSCLIVGAGLAGLTAAQALESHGWQVTLLDKGRRAGGRMATRRFGGSLLDHGAQFFTTRDPRFRDAVGEWVGRGWAAPWFSEGGHTRYMGLGGMNALAGHLAEPFDVRVGTKVQAVVPDRGGWLATTETGETFRSDALLLTPPAPQSLALVEAFASEALQTQLRAIAFDPCFALLVTLDGKSRVPQPGYVRPDSGPIEWLADNSIKGVSDGLAALTLHSRADFCRQYLEAPEPEVTALLLDAAAPFLTAPVLATHLHRWRFSKPADAIHVGCVYADEPADEPAPIAFAGDAFAGSRIEGAFLSGLAAAERLIAG